MLWRMALSKHAVGAAPVDVGAALNLDGNRVIENIGSRPLRFVVAEAAGEAAPTDLGAGQLLRPGQRETVRATSGVPLWVWAPFPTVVGFGPDWDGGGASGGGRTLGPQTNTFGDATTADRATAEGLRDAYAGANAAWLAQYDADRNRLILLQWTGGGEVVQRRNVAGDDWEDVTDVIRGPAGAAGAAGENRLHIVTQPTYSAADNRIDLAGLSDPVIGSMIFAILPANLDRKSDQLSVRAGSVTESLSCPRNVAVAARSLTPGALVGMLRLAGQFRLNEHPPERPQDYRVVVVFGADAADDDLAAADLATTRAALSPEDGGLLDISAALAAAGVTRGTDRRYWWLGVPTLAPDPAEALNAGSDHFAAMAAYAGGPDYGGESYKWWRGQRGWTGSQRDELLVVQGTY